VLAIKNSIALLKQHPALGRPGRIIGTRELVVPDTPYIIPYRIKEDEIQILRVFHGSRKWPEKL
jgi:toxin ParE1/3/4